jgi:N-acetyl-anhydromuramyl-L-alanine amidase AmpD
MTVFALQRRLKSLGYEIAIDGIIGPQTLRVVNAALDKLPCSPVAAVSEKPIQTSDAVVPAAWMPAAKMTRIICHWTAGTHKANSTDKAHYHILIEGDGSLVRGVRSIKDNEAPIGGGYAAHTLNCNTGSIGVSLCCMAGATESPFDPGKYPMRRVQWERLVDVVADLCERYAISVTRLTVLSHAEVQATLGIKQRNKWDFTRLAFDSEAKGALVIGNMLRAAVTAKL